MSLKSITAPPDGLNIGKAATDRIGLYGVPPIPQRSAGTQAINQPSTLGMVHNYSAIGGVMSNAVTITAGEVTLTSTGLLATDFVVAAMKPTAQAGMGIAGVHANANDTTGINLINPTAANVVPTANQQYVVTAFRNLGVISANFGTVSNCNANSTMEQEFDLSPSGAVATSNINVAGGVTQVKVANGGTGYYTSPTVVFTPVRPVTDDPLSGGGTGTADGLPANQGGGGATAIATVSGGTVVSVQITNPGSGYTAAPYVSFVGGVYVVPGMVAQVNKAAFQAGLGIGNVRVTGNNKVAVQYVNPTAANITPTANETYKVAGFFGKSAISPVVQVQANLANITQAGANANATAFAVTVEGIAAGDIILQGGPVSAATGANKGGFVPGVAAANSLPMMYVPGVVAWTPANGIYNWSVFQPAAPEPVRVRSVYITPAAVATKTTAEQVFSLPANITLQANSAVLVNKQTYTPGISIVGARANASNELAITYMNTTAAAITPPAEVYLFADFQAPIPTIVANMIEGWSGQTASASVNRLVDGHNEVVQSMTAFGQIKGA